MANEDRHGDSRSLLFLLSSQQRGFLVYNCGNQVEANSLDGKVVGLYFSSSWCELSRHFTPTLIQVYEELSSKGNFEVVFISSEKDYESFSSYFSKMPWLAIPFSDQGACKLLKDVFGAKVTPNLVILDANGRVSTDQGVKVIKDYGAEAFPFSPERVDFLRDEEENASKHQTLSSILVTKSCDYLISNDGDKTRVSDLEGKMVGLYFSVHNPSCQEFTSKLVEAHNKLQEKGETNFDVVFISLDQKEEDFKQHCEEMPWFALPFDDRRSQKLVRYFEIRGLPALVIIGQDGKTLNPNAAQLIEEHGIEAFPFTPEKVVELSEIEEARNRAQTLKSVLVHGEKDYVIEKGGSKVAVSELVGKNILLYFSAHWCPPCRAFTPKLIQAYHQIKSKDDAFEVIFISRDHDNASFGEYYSSMPWLALPFGDERTTILQQKFKVKGIPSAVAIGPSGRTLTTEARWHIITHGADAYPFTQEHLTELEEKLDTVANRWPQKQQYQLLVAHQVIRSKRGAYMCNHCGEIGFGWSFYCRRYDFDLHPKCALEKEENDDTGEAKYHTGSLPLHKCS